MSPLLAAWLMLIASILFEIIGMLFLKYSNGFANLLPTAGGIICFLLSIWTFSVSIKNVEMGIAYAVWASASTAIIAVIGIAYYQESISVLKMAGIMLIILGVAMLNLAAK